MIIKDQYLLKKKINDKEVIRKLIKEYKVNIIYAVTVIFNSFNLSWYLFKNKINDKEVIRKLIKENRVNMIYALTLIFNLAWRFLIYNVKFILILGDNL